MTTSDPTTPADPWLFFDMIGVPHLERFLDEGADFSSLPAGEIDSYASVAAVRWYGPTWKVRGEDAGDVLAGIFFHFVSSVVSGTNCTEHPDGRVTVKGVVDGGGDVEVTEERLRHWQWMLMLTAKREVADRFLAAVPTEVRDRAMARATSGEAEINARFAEIVMNV